MGQGWPGRKCAPSAPTRCQPDHGEVKARSSRDLWRGCSVALQGWAGWDKWDLIIAPPLWVCNGKTSYSSHLCSYSLVVKTQTLHHLREDVSPHSLRGDVSPHHLRGDVSLHISSREVQRSLPWHPSQILMLILWFIHDVGSLKLKRIFLID